jgi:hypothetical protein
MKVRTRIMAWALTALALGAVFILYTRPDFMVQTANQLWSCF